MLDATQIDPAKLKSLSEIELRALAGQLLERIDRAAREIHWRDAKIEKLTFEMAQLRRIKFGVKSEQLDGKQKTLFDEAVDADMAALEAQLAELKAVTHSSEAVTRPKRAPLPAHLPRIERHHEPTAPPAPVAV